MMSSTVVMCSPKTLTPLPPVRPVGLTTMSVPIRSSARPDACQVLGERELERARDPVLRQQLAHEALGGLDHRGRLRRARRGDAGLPEPVREPGLEGCLGADDRQLDALGLRELDDLGDIRLVDVGALLRRPRDPRVPVLEGRVDLRARARERRDDRVLPSPSPDGQYSHHMQPSGASGSGLKKVATGRGQII